jgi:esterase/lipase
MHASASSNFEDFKKIESSWIEILPVSDDQTQGSYPWWARLLQQDSLKLDPTGEGKSLKNEQCRPEVLQGKASGSPAAILGAMDQYFKDCESQLRTSHTDILTNTLGTLFLKLHPRAHPMAHHVLFHMPGGVRLKGLLALKSDDRPRPLVILRLGIFSHTEEFFPERYLFMQLFEQSPFHILVLESLSGSDYVKHNSSFEIGGFEEGFQNYWIAKKLQNPKEPLSKRIDSIHLVGVSLGGNGTFFAALLNQWNGKPISSFLGFCPLVQFEETVDYHRTQGWSMKAINFWAKKRLSDLQKIYPDLDQNDFVPSLLTHLKTQKETWSEEHAATHWPSDYSKKTFAERLKFWSEWKGIESPFLVFATRKDPIVPFEVNSQKLIDHDIDVGDSRLKIITLEQGYHCSLPSAYDWKSMATIFQIYIGANAKGWKPKVNHWHTKLNPHSADEIHWIVRSQGIFLTQSAGWFSNEEEEFPLEALPFYRLAKPLSPEAQSMLLRWLNQNMKLLPKAEKSSGSELGWQS